MGGEDTEYPATGTTAYWWGRHRIDCSLPPPAVASEVGATYWDSRDVASLIAKVLVPDEPAEASVTGGEGARHVSFILWFPRGKKSYSLSQLNINLFEFF
jgi:hypothetical protein